MKRCMTIHARGDGIDAMLRVTVETEAGRLTSDELGVLMEDLASRLMSVLPGTRYAGFTLSRMRASGQTDF